MFHLGVSKNMGKPPKSSILIGFGTIILTIHFGVPLFLETSISTKSPETSHLREFLRWWSAGTFHASALADCTAQTSNGKEIKISMTSFEYPFQVPVLIIMTKNHYDTPFGNHQIVDSVQEVCGANPIGSSIYSYNPRC